MKRLLAPVFPFLAFVAFFATPAWGQVEKEGQPLEIRKEGASGLEEEKSEPPVTVIRTPDNLSDPSMKLQEEVAEKEDSRQGVSRRSKEAIALEIGWWRFRQKDYEKAVELFTQASEAQEREVALEAKLGLGYGLVEMEDEDGAVEIFEDLVKQEYKLQDTAPLLVELLLRKGEYEKAEKYLDLLP